MISTNSITDFHGDYYWLDNMYLISVEWSPGLIFNSTEQGFVYFKTLHHEARIDILKIQNPYEVKAYGRNMKMRLDWNEIKFGIMYELVSKKFSQHLDLQNKLVDTGDQFLVEGNSWHDNIWGDCLCSNCVNDYGQNWLGKILMSIRAQYQEFA